MPSRTITAVASARPLPPGAARGWPAARRRAFGLVELLVVISIILVLMALTGAALSGARSAGARQKTLATISAIDEVLARHFVDGESSRAASNSSSSSRGAAIRRRLTADMPDSWEEVKHMQDHPQEFQTARHRSYIATFDSVKPTPEYSDAECLFMIVTQGGLADCLTCSAIDGIPVDDLDNDGAPEFLDAWGEPIRYVLWPGGFELPVGTKFFSQIPPFDGTPPTGGTGGTLRPLIFSGGSSKKASTEIHGGSYLALGSQCGDPTEETIARLGGLPEGSEDNRRDNLTNFDREVKR